MKTIRVNFIYALLCIFIISAIPSTVFSETRNIAQDKIKVKGVVLDATGEPLIGVSVVVKSTKTGTVTDLDGQYSIDVPSSSSILVASYIGFTPQEQTVGSRTTVNFTLKDDSQLIGEVVVTALGIKRSEKELGYSVQKISGEALQTVKGTNVATSLTGKIAGLQINNSTELKEGPEILLRGAEPLYVIDGVPYVNMKLGNIAPEDIEDINVLKGPTAAALYGAEGRNGAIMITTKRGKDGKLSVNVSNNTMFKAGYLRIPEKQTSYASGQLVPGKNGEPGTLNYDKDFVWGPYMDGTEVYQYDGKTKSMQLMPLIARGKNNLNNFLQNSLVTNTNISVAQATDKNHFRISGTHTYTKGQVPNSELTKFNLMATGGIKAGRFSADATFTIEKQSSPNMPDRVGYGTGNLIYLMSVWTGADYDIKDFEDYWSVKNEKQNWPWTKWYDNPYMVAHERLAKTDNTLSTLSADLKYDFGKYLKAQFRSGFDNYNATDEVRYAMGNYVSDTKLGYYEIATPSNWSWKNDLILTSNFKVQDFSFDLLAGGATAYRRDDQNKSNTTNGLSMPDYYSLAGSLGPINSSSSVKERMSYGIYGKATIGYKSMAFLDLTGRNDWSSTLPSDSRSYFYPSAGLSFIPTELYNPIENIMDYIKLRGSWTVIKFPPGLYETSFNYDISQDAWNQKPSATNPEKLSPKGLKPVTRESFEAGIDLRFFKNRLGVDFTYFNQKEYNRILTKNVSMASGFEKVRVNSKEDIRQKGIEFTITGKPIVTKNFEWTAAFNIGYQHWYYDSFDEYSNQNRRLYYEGARTERFILSNWAVDPSSGMTVVGKDGLPIREKYSVNMGDKDPDFSFGFANNFRIKDFSVAFSFDGRIGGTMWARTNQAMWNTGTHPDSDNADRYNEMVNGGKYIFPGVKVVSGEQVVDTYGNIISDNRVFAPNDIEVSYSNFAKTYNGNSSGDEAYRPQHLVDPSFIKLRELAINYTVPKKYSNIIKCERATVGLIGQNLWMWTKSKEFKYSDPDRGKENMNSPSYRNIGFNINLTF